jgi:SulP family sulfate permease
VIYPFLGTSRHVSIGPVALDMIIIGSGVAALGLPAEQFIPAVIYLTLSAGILQILMGVFKLGFVFSFFSRPVIDGFTLAAPIIIAVSQLGNFTGISSDSSAHFFWVLHDIFSSLDVLHLPTLATGFASVVVLVVFKKWVKVIPGSIVVVAGGILASWLWNFSGMGMEIVADIPEGLPGFMLPMLDAGIMRELLPTSLTLALVQFMTLASLGKVFAMRHRYQINPNKELIALGSSNVGGSFFQSLPVTASFSRTSVAEESGSKTALTNMITALVVGLVLLFLTELFYFLPIPVLAAIIIVSAVNLVDVEEIRFLFEARRSEGTIAMITAGSTLIIGIQEGILLGIGASMLFMLFRLSRPEVAELGHIPGTQIYQNLERKQQAKRFEEVIILRVDASFSFVNADYFKKFILEQSHKQRRDIHFVVIDGSSINDLDTTAIDSVATIVDTLRGWDIELYFTGLKGPVRDVVKRSGLRDKIGRNHFYQTSHDAIKEILGELDVRDDGKRSEDYKRRVDEG